LNEKFDHEVNTLLTRAPLGFDLKDGALVINEAEAPIVRAIFALSTKGESMKVIARTLNGEGLHGKNGGRFDQAGVMHILHNPAYAGYVFHRGILKRNWHPAIISIEEFNRAAVARYLRTQKHHRFPLLLGPERLAADRLGQSGLGRNGPAVYVPRARPPELDALIAKVVRQRA
jgi:hypothetical protein